MKKWKRNLIIIISIAYTIHVAVVISWKVFPIAEAENDGKIYTIRQGFGGVFDFVPLIGIAPAITEEPVYLTIEDNSTGKKQYIDFDLAMDVYGEYPGLFSEK